MFGQTGSSPFGTPAATPFGSSTTQQTPAFGSPAPAPAFGFGSTASTTPAFGQPQATTGAFGSTTPATGFGAAAPAASAGFGSPAPAPAFGSTASTPFGAPAPASGGLFGAPAPAPATGGLFGAAPAPVPAFGAPAPATGGLFGAPAPAPATGGFGGFGSTAAPAPAFGAPPPATTGVFGAPAPAPGGLFGSPAPAPATGGLFGAPTTTMGVAGGAVGSKKAPYQATRKVDGAGSINFQAITAMAQYENQSFEELRLEDYLAGNKGSQGQPQPTSGFGAAPTPAFGAPAPATGGFGFGSTPAPAPAAGGLFGSPTPAPATGGFGFGSTPAPAPTTGLFGAPAPATGGLFGSAPTPAPATGGLFGAPAPAAGGGLFGSTAAPAPATGGLFGSTPAPAPATGGLFGSAPTPAPATGGLFGAPAPAAGGGLFGSTPAPAPATGGFSFGGTPAPAPATGGLFGSTPAPAPATGGLFGSTPAPAPATGGFSFGGTPAPAPATGGLFGAPAPAPLGGGLFGSAPAAPKPAGGLFGTPAPAPVTGGLFGTPAPAPAPVPTTGGLFGAPTAAAPVVAPAVGTTILVPPASETLLAQQMAAIENQNKELAVLEAWRGKTSPKKPSGSSTGVIPSSVFQKDAQSVRYRGLAGGTSSGFGNSSASSTSPSILDSYQAAPRSTAKIRPRGFGPASMKAPSISALGSRSAQSILSPTSFLGSATKQLVIKPGALTPKPKTRLLLSDDAASEKNADKSGDIGATTPSDLIKGRNLQNGSRSRNDGTPASVANGRDRSLPFENSRIASDKPGFVSPGVGPQERMTPPNRGTPVINSTGKKETAATTPVDESYDFYRSVIGSPVEAAVGGDVGTPSNGAADSVTNELIPKLTKSGYVMTPSADELSKMSEADLAAVPNFVVERVGFGSVAWDGAVDVRGIDLDSVVCIEAKAVEVYHKEEEKGSKPAVGTKLNRPAILTLHDVYPKSGPDASDVEKEKFERKIAKSTKAMGASLILYDADIGVWKLHVEHFSRYALDDDSDDEDEVGITENANVGADQKLDFEAGTRGGRVPSNHQVSWATVGGNTRFNIPDDEDDEMEEENKLVQVIGGKGQTIQAAEAAYAELSRIEDGQMELDWSQEAGQKSCYVDEGVRSCEYVENNVFPLPSGPVPKISICAQIARRCGVRKATSSTTDFGMRMGRSFGICWKPDGSFLHLSPVDDSQIHAAKTLIQSRPVLDSDISSTRDCLLSIHLKHNANKNDGSDCPIFSLSTKEGIIGDYCETAKNQFKDSCESKNTLNDITAQVFSLLSVLFDDLRERDSFYKNKRKDHGFIQWLRNACSHEVDQCIVAESAAGNHYAAIFAALSGGNVTKAASIARSNGYHMLTSLLVNGCSSSQSSLSNQMKLWNNSGAVQHFPPELLRIYSFLAGDLELEKTLFQDGISEQKNTLGWKQRLMMLIKSIDGDNGGVITAAIKLYEEEVKSCVAPPALAWFREQSNPQAQNNDQCTLYRIMKLFSSLQTNEEPLPLSSIISPAGHSPNGADVSRAFHFAAILSSFGICDGLSESEEFSLLESYASQLQSAGSWEWAVYVSLCRLNEKPLSSYIINRKQLAAFDIIKRNFYSENDEAMEMSRKFLENEIGIPSSWFELASSLSAIQSFDVKSYISHSASTSTVDALQTYEHSVLPDIFFNGGKDGMENILTFLDELDGDSVNASTLRGAVYNYLELYKEISNLASDNMDDLNARYQHLIDRARAAHQCVLKLHEIPSTSWKLFDSHPLVPSNVTISELSNCLSILIINLNNFMTGKVSTETENDVTTLTSARHPAFSSGNDDLEFNQLDPMAGIRGKYRMVDLSVPVATIKSSRYRPRRL